VEIFKQPQYDPVSVEAQVAILWAVQNNYVDDVPVEKVKDFQQKLSQYLHTRKAELLSKIKIEKAVSDALGAELKAAVTEFKQTYSAGKPAEPAVAEKAKETPAAKTKPA
jgi:F-type H+/Na+-transporting ATPase subunit alpha